MLSSQDCINRATAQRLRWSLSRDAKCIQRLLQVCNPKKTDDTGRTALHHAAETGNADVALLLSKPRAILKAKDDKGRTALFMAAENGREAIVQALVELGVDVNGENDAGRAALFMAAENGHKAVVKLLLAPDGIDLDSKDKWGRAPLPWAARNGREKGTTSQPRLERTSAR
jgi:ankyrin repeat protein